MKRLSPLVKLPLKQDHSDDLSKVRNYGTGISAIAAAWTVSLSGNWFHGLVSAVVVGIVVPVLVGAYLALGRLPELVKFWTEYCDGKSEKLATQVQEYDYEGKKNELVTQGQGLLTQALESAAGSLNLEQFPLLLPLTSKSSKEDDNSQNNGALATTDSSAKTDQKPVVLNRPRKSSK